jgi:uncharacterized protein YbjT (DUF2867 family)
MKYQAEQDLKASGLQWTIIAPGAFMESALAQYGDPLIQTGRTRIYGRGSMPINFVSADDVAAFVERAISDPALRSKRVKVAGPESLTLNQLVRAVQSTTGTHGRVRHVPPDRDAPHGQATDTDHPAIAREIKAGIFLDTVDRQIKATPTREAYPSIPVTWLAEVIGKRNNQHAPNTE